MARDREGNQGRDAKTMASRGPIGSSESTVDIHEIMSNWDSLTTDSKISTLEKHLSFLIRLQSSYVDYLNGKLAQDQCPPKDELLFHVSILKNLDAKLLNQSRLANKLLEKPNQDENLALLNLFTMKLIIWDLLYHADHIPKSHLTWMENGVFGMENRREIEDAIFDQKRYCRLSLEEENKESGRKRKRSSSTFKLQAYISFKRKRDKKKYLKDLKEAYWASEEKCMQTAKHARALFSSLAIKSKEFDIPQYRLRIATLIKNLSSLVTTPPRRLSLSAASVKTSRADTMDKEEFLITNKRMYLFGGYDGAALLSTVDCYSPLSDTKKSLGTMNIARTHAAAAALYNDIYVFGGWDGSLWLDTVESYNPHTNEWTPHPSLTRRKGCLSGVTLYARIYAIGGGNGEDCFSDVEMFEPALLRWFPTRSMHQKRSYSAAVELNSAIYVAGGFDGQAYLNSVERFDPREVVSWSSIPSMNFRRGCHSLVAMNEKLYALGGFNGEKMLSCVEEFDPRKNSWVVRDEMKEARGYATAAVFGESIYVISGVKDDQALTETVECYKEGQGWSLANLKGVGKRCLSTAVSM